MEDFIANSLANAPKHLPGFAPAPRQLTAKEKQMLRLIEMEEKILKARESYKDFIEFMMPDPKDYDNPTASQYTCKPVHQLMIDFWTNIDSHKVMRGALSVPPQTGKTTHTSVMGTAWTLGRNNKLHIAIGTYNETRAKEIGDELRALLTSPRYKLVFPDVVLTMGGKNKSHLILETRGDIRLVGRGTGITGRPVDLFIVDDPVKDAAEANSTAALEECWKWFSTTAMQRAHNLTRYVVIHTRWAANDLIGRICDPDHPEYNENIARGYVYLNVKAYNNEPEIAKIMGIAPEACIWPEKFSPQLLESLRQIMAPQDFSALYMGKPVPDEGDFFEKSMIHNYEPQERPPIAELRVYAASDHAFSTKTKANYSVIVIAGVDKSGQIWLLDVIRGKFKTDKLVDKMLDAMKLWKPITWWAAKDAISGSIGPFLRKRMQEDGIFTTHIQDNPEIGDKIQKAQPIRGLMAMGRVRFPVRAHWYQDLVNELLRFRGQGDAADDQVDAMAHLGRGLNDMIMGRRVIANDTTVTKALTLGWIMAEDAQKKAEEARRKARAGW